MLTTKHYKLLSLLIFSVIFAGWVIGSNSMNSALVSPGATTVMAQTAANDDFVGSETCRTCHEPQFDSVAKTTHGKLEGMSSWEGKAVGCESCHGPGREHVEGGGDVTKIKVFKDMDPKAVSETCLTCHTGREAHNNFRRGDHWRNNVGCTDCHTAHGPGLPVTQAGFDHLHRRRCRSAAEHGRQSDAKGRRTATLHRLPHRNQGPVLKTFQAQSA
jgi:hypothetical protein